MSIVGGLDRAVESAKEIGANTLQIFSSPPRNWKKPRAKDWEIQEFRNLVERYQISPVFIHAKYLVNLASKNEQIRQKSVYSLIADLNLAAKLKACGVIFHPHPKNPQILRISIRQVLAHSPKSTYLILENSARMKLEEMGKVFQTVDSSRLRFCLDLAHAFQAGYELTRPQVLEEVFKVIKEEIGFDRWMVVHANDSKTSLGSKNDRHEDVAKGKLGPTPFFVLLNHPLSSKLPFIIETPGFKEKGLVGDKENLAMLRKLKGTRLGKRFFHQPTVKVAKELLGKYLIVCRENQFQVGKITETEAYVGPQDKASHASRGKTDRNKIMWGPPGQLYVYFVYGMYYCLNVVTEKEGYPAAVLIRGLEPVFGIRGKTDGPGKICRELKITTKDTGLDITKSYEIYIKDIGERPKEIIAAPRIGVDYAGEWAKRKWRFATF